MISENKENQSMSENKSTLIDDPALEKALVSVRAAIDKNAENVKILDLRDLAAFTDYFVICSGTSDRQVQAICDSVKHTLSMKGQKPLAIEGYSDGRWILLDFGEIIVHVFLDALRDYYDLENLWVDALRVKIPPEFYGTKGTQIN